MLYVEKYYGMRTYHEFQPHRTAEDVIAKVGIITFHRGNQNYGSTLQAYCLQRMIAALGHEARVIDYIPLRQPLMSLWYACQRRLLKFYLFRNASQKRFLREHGALTRLMGRRRALHAFPVLVTGSDEVWKVRPLRGFDPIYFLHGIPAGTTTISYAASCVASPAYARCEDAIMGYVRAIRHVSVREPSTARFVERWTGVVPEIVLDPTLACQDFDVGTGLRVPRPPFLYVYSETRFGQLLCSAALDYAKRNGLELHSFNQQPWLPEGQCFTGRVDVEDFVGCFRDAAGIVTDTFHGVCVAVRCRTPFVFISRSNKRYKASFVLFLLGLEEREVLDATHLATALARPIDWDAVDDRLGKERDRSLAFLRAALS